MPRKKTTGPTTAAPVRSYKHDSKRVRIPTQEESVKLSARDKQPVKKKYEYDPSFDPQLQWIGKYRSDEAPRPNLEWAGKTEQGAELAVPTVPIYMQEKIASEAIIAHLKLGGTDTRQTVLFTETAEDQFGKAVDFYKHEDNWQNRMILGDSLLVMNSLLEKEGMRGRVQTIYIDPPYGIRFGSNWQVSTRKRDVKDNKLEDFIRQPEQVKAFRDTWELGIHSYLSYLRDRLLVARELLTERGSCFVQINDENVHLVRNLMDEVFRSENFFGLITFTKTRPLGAKGLPGICDYLVWYAKNSEQVKFRTIYGQKEIGEGTNYTFLESPQGERRKMTREERNDSKKIPQGWKVFQCEKLASSGYTETCYYPIEFEGKIFNPKKTSWRTNKFGMKTLIDKKRLHVIGDNIYYVSYFDDNPCQSLANIWTDSRGEMDPHYVVQTTEKIVQRCLLMTTDPGDIVLDPTCGSGTTAFVAEQWGRRLRWTAFFDSQLRFFR